MKKLSPPAAVGLALTLAFLAAVPVQGLPRQKDEWIEVRSANFTLFSNAGARNTTRIGADLERLRTALAQLMPRLTLSSPYPTSIFVFGNASSFKPYQRVFEGKSLNVGGYFMSRELGNFVAIDGNPKGDGTAIIYHEYLHYVLRNNYASLPLWLNEGLAEYYSTFEVTENEAKIGLPLVDHLRWLRGNKLIPLPTLLAINESSPEYNENERRGGFYAQSWALVHYLLAGKPERREQAVRYLQLLQDGAPLDTAFQRSFGDAAALERELRTYVQSYAFSFSRAPIRSEADLSLQVLPMAWPDVLTRLGDLLVNIGPEHHEEAAKHFRAALEAKPGHGPALAGLGQIEEEAGRLSEAQAFYEQATRGAPDDFLVQYRYGRNLLEIDQSTASLAQARAALAKAAELRPEFGEAWARLGYTWTGAETLPPEAVRAQETAHRLLPSRMDVAHNLAVVYAQTGQRQKAEEVIARMIAARAPDNYVENAREAIVEEDHRRAEDLVGQQKLEEALPLLEQVRDRTQRAEKRTALEARITEIRNVLEFNRFADRYNEAVRLANQGDRKGAIAVLEPLVESTKNPDQARQAREMIEALKELQRKR
ncbi:MAG: tetratricopeptide repeat protein [Thermoanaerobaculia bacterium]